MEAAALAAPDGRPLTWRPSASSRTATRLLLQIPRSSCIVLHGVDLKFSPAPGAANQQPGDACRSLSAVVTVCLWTRRCRSKILTTSAPVRIPPREP